MIMPVRHHGFSTLPEFRSLPEAIGDTLLIFLIPTISLTRTIFLTPGNGLSRF